MVKNVLTLFSGSALAQIIPFIALYILAKFYSEKEFGYLFTFNSIILILAVLSTLKLEISLVLPKTDNDAKRLFLTAIGTSILVSVLIFLILLILEPWIEKHYQLHSNLGVWYYFIPIAVWILGINQIFEHWLTRLEKYKPISGGKIIRATGTSLFQITLKNLGLIGGFILGQLMQGLWYFSRLYNEIKNIPKTNFEDIKALIKTYRKIPIYNTLAGLTNTLSNQMPVLLLSYFYNIEIAAFYGMAHRVIATPMGMVSQSISQVFYQDAAKKFNTQPNDFHSFVKKSAINLLKLAIAPFIILFILPAFFVEVYLGKNWIDSVIYMQMLIPWLFIGFINTPLISIATILRKQHHFFKYDLILLIFRTFALTTGYYLYQSPIMSIALFCGVSVIFNLGLTYILLRFSKNAVQG